MSLVESVDSAVREAPRFVLRGTLTSAQAFQLRASLARVSLGDFVTIKRANGSPLRARVVAFADAEAVLMPLGAVEGVMPGADVDIVGRAEEIFLSPALLGCVVDSMGQIVLRRATGTEKAEPMWSSIEAEVPSPYNRKPVSLRLETGVCAIDAFAPLGCGQRMAVLAEAGAGKSTLLSMIGRNNQSDVTVLALIGERGREVSECIDSILGGANAGKIVCVTSTSDQSALARVMAAKTATRIAEYFRDSGKNVLLLVDSLTRLLRAFREVGLAVGETPVRHGYPPSVFSELPKLLERAANSDRGTLSALYTLLLTSEVDEDPMVEEVKSITDGHLVLSRKIAEQGRYPAIDILQSLSRCEREISTEAENKLITQLRRLKSRAQAERDVVAFGGTVDAELKQALSVERELDRRLMQNQREACSVADTFSLLAGLF